MKNLFIFACFALAVGCTAPKSNVTPDYNLEKIRELNTYVIERVDSLNQRYRKTEQELLLLQEKHVILLEFITSTSKDLHRLELMAKDPEANRALMMSSWLDVFKDFDERLKKLEGKQ